MATIVDELFELCKEVYEKTGWVEIGYSKMEIKENGYPLYTSDYLLEKLPYKLGESIPPNTQWLKVSKGAGSYISCYGTVQDALYLTRSNTPLKALLKLTLKLHEAGEL